MVYSSKEIEYVYPLELYERMLHDLHEGHKGIEKMQHLTRDRIYWQGMDADITEYIKNCKICTRHKTMQAIQPMLPRDIPEGPWQDLAADFFPPQQLRLPPHHRHIL